MSDLELAFSLPIGLETTLQPLVGRTRVEPRAAFESVVLVALQRPPCLVAFSGGRDSSTVLAVATALARREGLPLPIPVTHRFPDVPDSDETQHQENVVSHVGSSDWLRLEWRDEMDVVGPLARRAAHIAGVGPPVNSHFLLPIFDLARGGSVLTGNGGDQVFDLRERPAASLVRYAPRRVRARHLRGAASGFMPRVIRRARLSRQSPLPAFQWFTGVGRHQLQEAWSDWLTRAPLRYDRAVVDWYWRSRVVQVPLRRTDLIARSQDVVLVNAFEDPRFLSAFATQYGAQGPAGRARGLRSLAADVVPESVISRSTKASFNDAFITDLSRRAASEWAGDGVNTDLVDVNGLRREWSGPEPLPQSLGLLQAVVFGDPHVLQHGVDERLDGLE